MGELLNVPYCHLVFTLPHELNALAGVHPRWVYATLMQCAAATLNEFAANPRWLGGIGSFTLVLHTWTQDLRRHLHVHALMACGALQLHADADADVVSSFAGAVCLWCRQMDPAQALAHLLVPGARTVKGVSGQVLAGAARRSRRRHAAARPGPYAARAPPARERAAPPRLGGLRQDATGWAGGVLDYLSRYTHRTAIGNERIVAIQGDKVLVRVRADDTGGKRTIGMDGQQFIARFLQHVLPAGFKRIRHYGLLAPAAKTARLALARQVLAMPAANPQACEDAKAFMQRVAAIDIMCCPHCKGGRWFAVQHLAANRAALAAITPITTAACRGPP